MGSLGPPELALDSRISSKPFLHKPIRPLADILNNQSVFDKISKLDDYVYRLQEEMKKIDAFKRELPLCMNLLNDAISTAVTELDKYRKLTSEPVLEEFIPLKKIYTEEKNDKKVEESRVKKISSGDKMKWMSSVQLWSSGNHQNTDLSSNKASNSKKRKEEEIDQPAKDDLFQSGKNRTVGKAFVPFKGGSNFPVMVVDKEEMDELPVPGLSLCTPGTKNSTEGISPIGFSTKSSYSRSASSSALNLQFKTGQQQIGRKQRRCWSRELHNQFISALQHLGGAQAATPKQIREHMQVDGLTNDEVKSHLQKYRIQMRRGATISTSEPNGLWTSQEQCGESLKQTHPQSNSPQSPFHFDESPDDEDDAKSESHS